MLPIRALPMSCMSALSGVMLGVTPKNPEGDAWAGTAQAQRAAVTAIRLGIRRAKRPPPPLRARGSPPDARGERDAPEQEEQKDHTDHGRITQARSDCSEQRGLTPSHR